MKQYFKSVFNRSDSPAMPRIEEELFVPLLMILALVAVINTLQSYAYFYKGAHNTLGFLLLFVSKLIYCLFFGVFAYITRCLSQRISFHKTKVLQLLFLHFITLASLVVIHQALSYGIDSLLLTSQIKVSFVTLFLRNMLVWLDIAVYIFCVIVFHLLQNRLISEENEYTYFQMEVALMNSQLHELRSKIHPKFLFNTLQTISSLIQTRRNDEANRVLSLFSNFLRATVYDIEQKEVSLEAEKSLLAEYLEIETVRFNDNLKADVAIPDACLPALVPNYLLQPILEELLNNAVVRQDAVNTITVSARHKAKDLIIELSDNFTDTSLSDLAADNGNSKLMISKKRLFQLFNEEQQIEIIGQKCPGITIRITIPYRTMQDNLEIKYAGERKYEY